MKEKKGEPVLTVGRRSIELPFEDNKRYGQILLGMLKHYLSLEILNESLVYDLCKGYSSSKDLNEALEQILKQKGEKLQIKSSEVISITAKILGLAAIQVQVTNFYNISLDLH